jgi:hypothetical protein
MADLFLHKRPVGSIFSLLGEDENDITYSIGWVLSRSPTFLRAFLNNVIGGNNRYDADQFVVSLQEFHQNSGITDIEIRGADIHLIVEAKRGLEPPSERQLRKYVPRFRNTPAKRKLIVTMAECSADYASHHLSSKLRTIPVRHVSWKEMSALSQFGGGSHAEKRMMEDLRNYLASIVTMQKQDSNWVYVVALSDEEWARDLTYIETVEKRRKYFHPLGIRGWPKEPPNYLGFRYYGILQQICHVESAQVVDDFHAHFPESPHYKEKCPYLLYELGKPIIPSSVVRTGKIYANGRKWAMFDLLLTSRTIAAACNASRLREEKI